MKIHTFEHCFALLGQSYKLFLSGYCSDPFLARFIKGTRRWGRVVHERHWVEVKGRVEASQRSEYSECHLNGVADWSTGRAAQL